MSKFNSQIKQNILVTDKIDRYIFHTNCKRSKKSTKKTPNQI